MGDCADWAAGESSRQAAVMRQILVQVVARKPAKGNIGLCMSHQFSGMHNPFKKARQHEPPQAIVTQMVIGGVNK